MEQLFEPSSWGSPAGVGFFLLCLGVFLYTLAQADVVGKKRK